MGAGSEFILENGRLWPVSQGIPLPRLRPRVPFLLDRRGEVVEGEIGAKSKLK